MPMDALGRPLRMTAAGIENSCWDSEQYSIASLIYERALAYRCRTHDPARADLFFVPAFKPRLAVANGCAEPGAHQKRALIQRLRIELPLNTSSQPAEPGAPEATTTTMTTTLEARGGADHIIVNPRNGNKWERNPFCELAMGSAALGAAQYLAMEQGPRVYPDVTSEGPKPCPCPLPRL